MAARVSLLRVGAAASTAVECGGYRTIGRVDLGLKDVPSMLRSIQHIALRNHHTTHPPIARSVTALSALRHRRARSDLAAAF